MRRACLFTRSVGCGSGKPREGLSPSSSDNRCAAIDKPPRPLEENLANKSNNYLSFGTTPLPDIDEPPPPPPEISKTTAGGFSNRISGLVWPSSNG